MSNALLEQIELCERELGKLRLLAVQSLAEARQTLQEIHRGGAEARRENHEDTKAPSEEFKGFCVGKISEGTTGSDVIFRCLNCNETVARKARKPGETTMECIERNMPAFHAMWETHRKRKSATDDLERPEAAREDARPTGRKELCRLCCEEGHTAKNCPKLQEINPAATSMYPNGRFASREKGGV